MENILTAMARQFLPQMEPEERAEALRSLKRMIDEEFFAMAVAESGDETARYTECPRCGSGHVVKRGLDGRGEQRFLCRRCSRTFTARTNRVFATTKLERATWMKFAECHVDVLTLRESAERCGVSLKTAFFMRHRILECIAQSMPAFRSAAGDGMEIDECYLRESFKGNRKNAACGIPRKAHHRPEGIDHYEQICVLTGINDAGDFFFEMTGRGAMSGEQAARFLEGKVASGTIVATDKAHAYRESLRTLDVRRHEAHGSREHAINRVNGLHSRIMKFIDGFHGVATRRLWNYLAWFKWIWSFRRGRTAEQTAVLVVKQVGGSPYKTTWRNYKRTPYPFYDYWVKQAKWDRRARAALPLAMGTVSKVG
jgi:Transposase and inactivated derivatives